MTDSEFCDVELYGHCDRCDHPCLAYFELIDGEEDFEFDDEECDINVEHRPLKIEVKQFKRLPHKDDPDQTIR